VWRRPLCDHQQRIFLPAWLRHNTYMPTTTNSSTATTSHEHYIKITVLPKFRRHLGTLGMKAATVSSARIVKFLRNHTASHFRITDTPETWLYTNRKSHKLSPYGFYYSISYTGKNRSSSGIFPSFYTFHPEISTIWDFTQVLTDVAGHPIGPIFKGHVCLSLEDRADGLPRNVGKKIAFYAA
jgi:hypothetical protein